MLQLSLFVDTHSENLFEIAFKIYLHIEFQEQFQSLPNIPSDEIDLNVVQRYEVWNTKQ